MTADNPEQTVPPASAVSSDDTSSAPSAAAAAAAAAAGPASTTTADGGPGPDPSPGPSIPLQRSASEARGMQSATAAAATAASVASVGTGQDSPGKRSHHHRRAHTTMSSSVAGIGSGAIAAAAAGGGGVGSSANGGVGSRSLASGAAAGNGSGNATGSSSAAVDGAGAATATTALQQQQQQQQQQNEEQDVPKVKLNIPGKNEDEVVVKRKGRFKILKDTAVTVVAPGPGAGSGQASESAAAGAAAITDGPPARVGESSAVSSGTIEAKVHQSSARGSPNKPPFPTPHTRSKSDTSAATSGSANAQRGVPARLQGEGGVTSAVSLASTAAAVQSAESVESSPGSGSTPAAANIHGSGNTGNANDRVQLTAGTVTAAPGVAGTSSVTTSPMNVVETITPAASFSPSIQQPHLGASPVVAGNVAVKQKGRFSITPASDDTAGLVGGAGSGDPSAPSVGGGVVTSNKRPPQYLQQPRLPPKHQSSQDSEATAPLAPSVDTRRRDCEEKTQRSPNDGQITEARTQPRPQQQPQQQQLQSKTNAKRQSFVQEQQGTSGPQNVQEHPSQPAGLFPEKHARAAATDKVTLGGVISSSNTAGRPGQNHLGKVFYFVEQMKIEVTEADKTMKKMQTDIRLLWEKNKELERKHVEEKLARETAEAKVRSLKKRIRELKEQMPDGAVVPDGITKNSKTNEDNDRGDEGKSDEANAASGGSNGTMSADQPPKGRAPQQGNKILPRTSSLSPKREVEERYGSKGTGTHPPPKISDAIANSSSKSSVPSLGKGGKGKAAFPAGKDATKEGKPTKPRESSNLPGAGNTAGNGVYILGQMKPATNVKQSLASSPRNKSDQQSMAKRSIEAALNSLGDLAQIQHVQQQQQQQQQPSQVMTLHVNYDSDSGANAKRSVAAGPIPSSIHLRASSMGTMDPMTLPMPGSAAPAAPAVATTVSFDPLGAPPDQLSGPQQQQISAGQGQILLGASGGGGRQQHAAVLGSNSVVHSGPSQYLQQQQQQQQQQMHWGQAKQWTGQQQQTQPQPLHQAQQLHNSQQAQSQSTAHEYQQQMSAPPPPIHSQYPQYQLQNIAEQYQIQQTQLYVPGTQSQGFQGGQQQQQQNPQNASGVWNNAG